MRRCRRSSASARPRRPRESGGADRRVGVRLDDERHHAVSEAWRARQVVALTRALARSDCNVGAVQLHTWVRPQPHRDPGDGYGIVGADGRQTATAVDYLATLRAIDDGSVGPPGADQPCWGPGLPDFGEL
jgi:hypothetical protein